MGNAGHGAGSRKSKRIGTGEDGKTIVSAGAEAYKENEQGWEQQVRAIEKYLRKAA